MPKGQQRVPLQVPRQGLVQHLPPHEVPSDSVIAGKNMILDFDGRYVVRPAYLQMAQAGPGLRISGGISYRDLNDDELVVVATLTGWHRYNFGSLAWDDITGTANVGDPNFPARFVAFEQSGTMWVMGVNGLDAMHRQDSTSGSNYVDVSAGPIARDIAVIARRVVCIATTESGTLYLDRVRWSSVDDGTTWGANNFIDLSPSGDPNVAIMPISQNAALIYRTRSIWRLTAQPGGNATAFRADRIGGYPGAMSPTALVEADGEHWYMGLDKSIYRFNGSRHVEISRPIKPLLESQVDSAFRGLVHGGLHPCRRQLWWWYVKTGDTVPLHAVVYNLDSQTWEQDQEFSEGVTASIRSADPEGVTWDSVTGTWDDPPSNINTWDNAPGGTNDILLLGTDAGQIHRFDSGVNDNGSAIAFQWDLPIVAPDPNHRYLFTEVENLFAKPGSVQGVTVTVRGYPQPLATSTTVHQAVQSLDTADRYRMAAPRDLTKEQAYPALQVAFSGTVLDNTSVKWAGGTLFADPDAEGGA